MAPRKRSKRSTSKNKKRRPQVGMIMVFGLLSAVACLIVVSFLVFKDVGTAGGRTPGHGGKTGLPAFEEKSPVPRGFQGVIGKIDKVVYEVFFNHGLSKEDISFQDVRPMQQNGSVWDFAELSVRCAGREEARELVSALAGALEKGGSSALRTKVLSVAQNRLVVEVRRDGFLTHAIALTWQGPARATPQVRPRLAIVIDDFGYDPQVAASFMTIGFPLSLSILPHAPFSTLVMQEAESRGLEVLLHLPMEPKGYPAVDPGKGALLLNMGSDVIRRTAEDDLAQLPGVRGVNNHMGSAFTEDPERMRAVMEFFLAHGFFYLDSRTSPKSVGYELARQMGVAAASRNVFLDDDPSFNAVESQLERLLSLARHSGAAVGIGHPNKTTLRALEAFRDRIMEKFDMVTVSDLTVGQQNQ